jgi:hypothetical protein
MDKILNQLNLIQQEVHRVTTVPLTVNPLKQNKGEVKETGGSVVRYTTYIGGKR